MAEFLEKLFSRLIDAPVQSTFALITFLVAAPLIIRIWRAFPTTTQAQPPAPQNASGLDLGPPWIATQVARQTFEIERLARETSEIRRDIAEIKASIATAVEVLKRRARRRRDA